jgi:hypothetical protein
LVASWKCLNLPTISIARKTRTKWYWYHLDRGIRQIDESRGDLSILSGGIESGSVPQRQDSTDELSEALCPISIDVGFAICGPGQYRTLCRGWQIRSLVSRSLSLRKYPITCQISPGTLQCRGMIRTFLVELVGMARKEADGPSALGSRSMIGILYYLKTGTSSSTDISAEAPMLGGVYIMDVGLDADLLLRVTGGVLCPIDEADTSRPIVGNSFVEAVYSPFVF